MKKKEMAKVREKSIKELEKKLKELRKKQAEFKAQLGAGKIQNFKKGKKLKQDIAQILTLLTEKRSKEKED